jgi:hypothetical protein
MALGSMDSFKAAFGSYDTSKIADWRAKADAALGALAGGVEVLKILKHDDLDTFTGIFDTQTLARGVAFGKEDAKKGEACAEYSAIAKAAASALKNIQTRVITALPGSSELKKIKALPDGDAILDRLVAQIGDYAGTTEKAELVAQAMKVRFDIRSLTGKLTRKAMPRMYELLRRLPDDHTVSNDKLKDIERTKERGASSYSRSTIVINATTAGKRGRETKYTTDTGKHTVKAFDAMMLHEVGHSVDDKNSIMGSVPTDEKFGRWREESVDSIVTAADTHLDFAADFSTVPTAMRKSILGGFLKGQVPSGDQLSAALTNVATLGYAGIAKDPGLKHAHHLRAESEKRGGGGVYYQEQGEAWEKVALTGKDAITDLIKAVISDICTSKPAPSILDAVTTVFTPIISAGVVDWDAMGRHKAGAWLAKIGASSEGNWRESSGALGRLTLDTGDGPRVFQQSYSGVYWSYLFAARTHMVRDYQFRAEGEWFAEVYAIYFLGLMGSGHAIYPWLHGQFGDPPEKMS